MEKIKFIWKYLTNASFRWWVDQQSYQEAMEDLKRRHDEKVRMDLHAKMYPHDSLKQ